MGARVIVGSYKEKVLKQLSQFLIENGYTVIGETSDGYDMLRRIHTVYPDICIIDYNMKGMNGHELSETLVAEKICPVIVLLSSSELHNFINLSQEPIFTPLLKPINKQSLVNTIDLLVKTSKSISKLEKEVKSLKNTQDTKQIVNKAKRLLMENMNLTEEEAHRRIQKQSMDKGISKLKIAEAIILMYDN